MKHLKILFENNFKEREKYYVVYRFGGNKQPVVKKVSSEKFEQVSDILNNLIEKEINFYLREYGAEYGKPKTNKEIVDSSTAKGYVINMSFINQIRKSIDEVAPNNRVAEMMFKKAMEDNPVASAIVVFSGEDPTILAAQEYVSEIAHEIYTDINNVLKLGD